MGRVDDEERECLLLHFGRFSEVHIYDALENVLVAVEDQRLVFVYYEDSLLQIELLE